MNPLRIANAAGFLGDNLDAPRLTVEKMAVERAEVDYLTLEYLAELTMSILARSKEKDPRTGYATDFITVLQSLLPALQSQSQLRIVTNAGGVNPLACARAAAEVLIQAGRGEVLIAVVSGDDLLPRLSELMHAGCQFTHLETGQSLGELERGVSSEQLGATGFASAYLDRIVSANAYLGARPIVTALSADPLLTITGRVADASLTVGPAAHRFGWRWDDWNTLAGGSVAGHIIECGAQATGGLFANWHDLHLADVGYPIAEVAADGSCAITKPAGTGGAVDRHTIAEQLVYEIGDPAHYLTPDVDVDFTNVELSEIGPDRVQVRGAIGRPATETYKVSLAYRDGYMASGQLLVYGRDCVEKARACGEMIRQRVARAGFDLARFHVECLGAGDGVPGVGDLRRDASGSRDVREVILRVSAHDPRREAIERFSREFAPLITSGPPGLAGYAAGRPTVRPVFAYWPTLVPKALVEPTVEVRSAAEWLRE